MQRHLAPIPGAACSKTPGHPFKNLSNFMTAVHGSCFIHSSRVSPRKSPTVKISSGASCFTKLAAASGLIPTLTHRKHVSMAAVAASSVSPRFISRPRGNRRVAVETVHGQPQGTVVTVRVGDITRPRICWNSLQYANVPSSLAGLGVRLIASVAVWQVWQWCNQPCPTKLQKLRRQSCGIEM